MYGLPISDDVEDSNEICYQGRIEPASFEALLCIFRIRRTWRNQNFKTGAKANWEKKELGVLTNYGFR